MTLTPVMERFVACWSDMGSRWGVNRSVAQVHAVFYLSPHPLNAEDLASTLAFSRSNVGTSLRELENWGLITPAHVRGDRKQYYEAIKDPWEIFRVILDERKRREIDPTVALLRSSLDEATKESPEDVYTAERLRAAVEFFEVMIPLYNELCRVSKGRIQHLAKLTAKIREVIG